MDYIKNNRYQAIGNIINPSEEMCYEAIRKDGHAIEYILKKNRTKDMCIEAEKHELDRFCYSPYIYIFRTKYFGLKNLI